MRWGVCQVNVEEDGDNPPFDGVFEFCQAYAGATLCTLRAPVDLRGGDYVSLNRTRLQLFRCACPR